MSLGDSSHPITTVSLSLALLLHFISSIFFSTQGFKAPLQHSWAFRAENQRVDFKLEESTVANCNICQVELRSLQGGNTLTPVPLAGTKFCGGEHSVRGSACRQLTSSWLLTFPPNSLSLRMTHPVLCPKGGKKTQQQQPDKSTEGALWTHCYKGVLHLHTGGRLHPGNLC